MSSTTTKGCWNFLHVETVLLRICRQLFCWNNSSTIHGFLWRCLKTSFQLHRMNIWSQFLVSRNESWSLSGHLENLKMTLKTWRKVFWRLWGQVHFLDCSSCNLPFAAADFYQCQFHPEQCFYPPIVPTRGYCNPIGKFTCCQKTSFRFSLIPHHGEVNALFYVWPSIK